MSKKLVAYFSASGMGNTVNELKPSVSATAEIKDGKRFSANASVDELRKWAESV